MSFYKRRSGGSLYRFKAIKGYVKHLFKKNHSSGEQTLQNRMSAKYSVSE